QSRFVPGGLEDWCAAGPGCISLELGGLGDLSNVVLKIENTNGFGNLMWVDNIAVTGVCTGSLPVEWLSFTAAAASKTSRLNWQVNQTEDHAGFAVEKRTDGSVWESIGWVASTGIAAPEVAYDFTDREVVGGTTYYYRLRQRDQDGTEALSEVRSVNFARASQLEVWPNPAGQVLNIQSPLSAADYTVSNLLGQVLLTGRLLGGTTQVDLQGFSPGVYLVRVREDEVVKVVVR
ncbi:MAG: T9SS type A sorting domain-containing protein, partial [Bacteroidota bacterium]